MNRRLLADSTRALRRYKWRSLLVGLGTLVGTALVTLVLALAGAAQAKMSTTIRQIFGDSSVLIGARGTRFLGGPRPGAARLTIDDIAAVAASVPGVRTWDPQQALPSASIRARERATTARVLGQSDRSREVWDRPAWTRRVLRRRGRAHGGARRGDRRDHRGGALPGRGCDRPRDPDRRRAVRDHRRAAALRHRSPRHGPRQRDRRAGVDDAAPRPQRRHDHRRQAGRGTRRAGRRAARSGGCCASGTRSPAASPTTSR